MGYFSQLGFPQYLILFENYSLMKKLTQILFVLLFLPALSFAQTSVAAAEIIAKINQGEAVSYRNARITGDLDLTQLKNKKLENSSAADNSTKNYISTVTAPLSFVNCTFTGKVLAYYNPNANTISFFADEPNEVYNTNFTKEVRFENCTFEEESAFKYSRFNSAVSFAGSTFKEEALFKYARFNGHSANFSNTTYYETANFKYVNLQESISFAGASFRDEADFKYAKFPKNSSFAKATFTGFANFKYAEFTNPILKEISFNGGSQDFKYTQVNGQRVNLASLSGLWFKWLWDGLWFIIVGEEKLIGMNDLIIRLFNHLLHTSHFYISPSCLTSVKKKS